MDTENIGSQRLSEEVKRYLNSDAAMTVAPVADDPPTEEKNVLRRFIIIEGQRDVRIAIEATTNGEFTTDKGNFAFFDEIDIRWTDPNSKLFNKIGIRSRKGQVAIESGSRLWDEFSENPEHVEEHIRENIEHPVLNNGFLIRDPLYATQYTVLLDVLTNGRVAPDRLRDEVRALNEAYGFSEIQDTHADAQRIQQLMDLAEQINSVTIDKTR